jgi:enoyl-CoA hydratase/carnithine racemase
MSAPHELVTLAVADGIATITLNRGDKANALSRELIEALGATVDAVAARCAPAGDVRVVVLAGAGKCFCAACRSPRSRACRAPRSAAAAG